MKTPSIHDTYCNPIVLPNYPCLQTLHQGDPLSRERPDTWNRRGKTILSEKDILQELGAAAENMMDVFSPGHGRVCEQDVRATADPSPYFFDGKWWLYPTCGMIYSSGDLVHWEYHEEPSWAPISAPMAPTVEKIGTQYVAAGNNTPVHTSPNPIGPWTNIGEWTLPDGREFTCGDVMMFADEDGRAYLYFGLGAAIMGAELDVRNPRQLITFPKLLVPFTGGYWWERFGASNEDWSIGFIEGSWMVRHGQRYHLVYSCSGTEFYNYAMGCYVSDSPLGEFKLQPRNPVSTARNTGLIKGAGHGGFVKGPEDSLWIFYTVPVCVDNNMERRIAMDPAGFDAEGNLYARSGCGVPQWKPGVMQRPELGNATELVPLTIFKPSQASSYAPGCRPLYAIDETLHTWWQPATDDTEPTLSVALQGRYSACAVRILWKDIGLNFAAGVTPGPYQYVVEVKNGNFDGEWIPVVDASQNQIDLTVDYRTFAPTPCTMVRIRILGAPQGITPGLLNFTLFGESLSKPNRQF